MSEKWHQPDLQELATKLLSNGPHKLEPAKRRVRVIFNKQIVADTPNAMFVWEHAFYPSYYISTENVFMDTTGAWTVLDVMHVGDLTARLWRYKVYESKTVRERSTERIISFNGGPLDGLMRFESKAMDQWLEEDQPIAIHPRDPYKRVDCLASTRPIKVSLNGTTLAESPYSVHLHETGLPVRFYIPMGHANIELLEKSETTTGCPYKGTANYYSVKFPGKEVEKAGKDLVWYYEHPTLECAAITGFLCFYNEKVDVELDGKKLERPKTHFA